MNRNKYIVLFVVVILAIVIFVFLSSKKDQNSEINTSTPAKVSIISVRNVTATAGAIFAGGKIINWQTAGYPTTAGVNVNLIKKIGDSPREFTLVRTLETDTLNDGEALWSPQDGEDSDDLYVEVTCSNSYAFQAGCSLSSDPIKVN